MKLSDIEGRPLSATAEAGSITVQSVSLTAASVECAAGEDAQMKVSPTGDFAPCGGEFEVRYDSLVLTAASVTAEPALGGVPISLTYSVDRNGGCIRISWAAVRPAGALGKLCTLHFAPEVKPMLYIAGGRRNADGTATVQIIADGPNRICGGEFKLLYDTSECTLERIDAKTPAAVTNPETAGAANGTVSVAWGHSGPSPEREVVLEATFQLAGPASASLQLEDVSLTGLDGSSLPGVAVYNGKADVWTPLQMPCIHVARTGADWRMDGFISSAADGPVQGKPLFALYQREKLAAITISSESITVGESGTAYFNGVIADAPEADQLKVFLCSPDELWIPLCEAAQLNALGTQQTHG